MATQNVKRNCLLNLYREENISLVCFFLPLKRDKNVWHLQPPFSTWRPLAFLPVTLSLGSLEEWPFRAGTQILGLAGWVVLPEGPSEAGSGRKIQCVSFTVFYLASV